MKNKPPNGKKLLISTQSLARTIITPVFAVAFALIVGALIILFMDINPLSAYSYMLKGAFGSLNSIGETIVKATPLIFTGLSFAVAHQCGLVNIGAEGQLYIGALFSTMVGLAFPGLPMFIHMPLAVLAGVAGGALWALVAAVLKVKCGSSEIIVTIMLNYVAIYFVSYMVGGPLIDPAGNNPQSPMVNASAALVRVVPGTRIHLGIIIALLCVVLYFWIIWKTTFGYSLRVVGINREAARYAGMAPNRSVYVSMLLAGGFAGLAGATEILGVQGRLFQNFSSGYGFDGIAVALLGHSSPVGIVLSALLFGSLSNGSNMMQMFSKVPSAIVGIIQSIVILFVVGAGLYEKIRNRQLVKRAAKEARANV